VRRIQLFAAAAFAAAGLLCIPPRQAEGASYYGLIRKGNRFFKNDLFREALGYYTRGGEKNPGAFEPAFNAGAALYKIEDYTRSVEILTRTLEETGKPQALADIHYNLGNNYFRLGDFEKAVEHYTKGLELDPNSLNMKYNLELAQRKLQQAEKQKEERNGGVDGGGKKEQDKPSDAGGAESGRGGGKKEPGKLEPGDRSSAPSQGGPSGENEGSRSGSFSKEEAERLIGSVNTDQSKIVGDNIKQRLGRSQNEKDW
jgi:Ca-activated chloride channel homolog